MSIKVQNAINQVSDPAARRALKLIFDTLMADQTANKIAFDAHTHEANGADAGLHYVSLPGSDTQDAGVSQGTATAFQNGLE